MLIERTFAEQRSRLELQTSKERQNDMQMVEAAKRDKANAEEMSHDSQIRVSRLEEDMNQLRCQLRDMTEQKDEYYRKSVELDSLRIEVERLKHVEQENPRLREELRSTDKRVAMTSDQLADRDKEVTNQRR